MSETPIYDALVRKYQQEKIVSQYEEAWDFYIATVETESVDLPEDFDFSALRAFILTYLARVVRKSVAENFKSVGEDAFVPFQDGLFTAVNILSSFNPIRVE